MEDLREGSVLRLVIVDADARVRDSLAALVGSDATIEVVGRAGHVATAIEAVERTGPDVVIVDSRLPEVDAGLALVALLRRRWPDLAILVMSWSHAMEPMAFASGADGFVRKSGGPIELVEAIVAAGRRRARRGPTVGDDPASGATGVR